VLKEVPRHENVLGDWRCNSPYFNLGTGWGVVVSFTPRSLYPSEEARGTHSIAGWVGARAHMGTVAEREILNPCRNLNPGNALLR